MRKVLVVDATFLSGEYGGMLVFATAQDPNRHHYPVAFGVIDRENHASWRWFMKNLKNVIPDDPELVFMSDRHQSIIKAVSEVYPSAHHGHCIWHLSQNVRKKVSNVNKDLAAEKFRECAHIYTQPAFNIAYGDFCTRFQGAVELVERAGIDRWARCYFPGNKYNIETSNSAESLNSVFFNARKYAILPMIDAIIGKMTDWFNKRRKDAAASSFNKRLVPVVENEIHMRCGIASHLVVTELNSFSLEYSVIGLDGKTYLVDLVKKSCCCRRFDIDKFPCEHAIAAASKLMSKEDRSATIGIYDLCSKYYLIDTWALAYYRTVYLVPHVDEWIVPDDIKSLEILPPDRVTKPGRNKERRFLGAGEGRRKKKNKSNAGINLGRWFEASQP